MANGLVPGAAGGLSLGAVLRAGLDGSPPSVPTHHWRTLRALLACRTPALGGHRYRCQRCGQTHFVPHSCRNRHCPLCQGQAARQWLEQQQRALLPVPYFHMVFTLPHVLNPLIRQNQRALYTLLFQTVSQTLLRFGQSRLGAQLGVTAVLHTWSQTLLDHYHVHCIVTGGGLSRDNARWVSAPAHYLFPVRALSKVYRGTFLCGLQKLYAQPVLQGKTKVSGIQREQKRILRLLEVLLQGASGHLKRWTTAQLRQTVLEQCRLEEKDYTLNQVRYDLRKIRLHGLIERLPHRYAYRFTQRGQKLARLLIQLRKRIYGPIAFGTLRHRPNKDHLPNEQR